MRKSIVTILGPTSPVYDLTTVDEVNAALLLESNTANDAITGSQITNASKLIADYCNRQFAMLDVSESYRQSYQTWLPHRHYMGYAHTLTLNQFPVDEITSITIGDAEADPTTYEVDKESGLIHYMYGHWWGNVVVVYSGGYNLPDDAPPLLAQACVELVAAKRRMALIEKRDPSLREAQHGDTRTMYFDYATSKGSLGPMPQSVLDLIQPYQRMIV